jgi:serine phosphatase RsbU (regulator of sigma subunit)/pSer/pThr/pTyr-binding forkhead associated (FHA) protein
MAYLTVIRGLNAGKRFELKRGANSIGRNPDCDIVFAVSAVSREHARIEWRDDRFFIEDLRSRNDTFVNDNKLEPNRPTPLGPGDRIKICDYVCEFSDDSENSLKRINEDTGTVISSLQASSGNAFAAQPAERLRVLLEISNNLARNVEMNRLLPSILDGLFQIYRQADRAFVIVKEETTDRFVPLAVKTRRERDESTARFSRTILNQCSEERRALLIEDAAEDKQLQLAASISGVKVRSIMAAPMISPDDEVFGVIQVDTQDRNRKFNQDDLQLLIAVVNQAAVALNNVKLHDDLIRRQRTQREIEVAKEVQLSFLPNTLPTLPGYDFFAHYQAAREVGGDFYGFLKAPSDKLAIGIGDVAGKGIPAALLMARITGDMNLAVLSESDPAHAVMKMNALFHQTGFSDRFVAFLLCILEPQTGCLTFVNAGQVPPLIRRSNGIVEEPGSATKNGLPLGIESDFAYDSCPVKLEPGDCLVLCTDGITDATDEKNETFGKERLLKAVKNGPSNAPELGESLLNTVEDFATAPTQFDDMTLVCVSRRS